MKKLVILAIVLVTAKLSFAQLNNGGVPLSFLQQESNNSLPKINVLCKDESKLNEKNNNPGVYQVGLFEFIDLEFPKSGQLIKSNNGKYIWRCQVEVDKGRGIGFYFDKFHLPKGATLFIYNSNKEHVLGGFDEIHNNKATLSTEPVAGRLATIEVNLENGDLIPNVVLSLKKIAVYHRSFEYLDTYENPGLLHETDPYWINSSSKCMINANCPQSVGYENAKKSTVSLIIPGAEGIGLCTGTMINNTGNSSTSCTRYLLTATHCEGTNSTSTGYNEWVLRYNYEQATCETTNIVPVSKTIDGVQYVARDPYDDAAPASDLDADFLLVRLLQPIPSTWDIIMSGWDRNPSHQLAYLNPKKFIGFHHPNGDIKKMSISKTIANDDVGDANSAWRVEYSEGYGAPGSSGSGYFNDNSQLIGVASIATYGFAPDTCLISPNGTSAGNTSKRVWYSKLAYCWNNPSNPVLETNSLKKWLDPTNSGVMNLGAVKSNCSPVLSVVNINNNENDFINIYPIPSTDKSINIKLNFKNQESLTAVIVDITGKELMKYDFGEVKESIIKLNLNSFNSGVYFIKFFDKQNKLNFSARKIII